MKHISTALALSAMLATPALASDHGGHDSGMHGHKAVADNVVATQRDALAKNTKGKGFGPQSPRDIDHAVGNNARVFSTAPAYTRMNLCNIHFHKNAEHKGGEFTTYAGNGNGEGYQSGYRADISHYSHAELKATKHEICPSAHSHLVSGDTIEVHYVYTTAQVTPGESLGSCLNDAIGNPQLRVETQVYTVVNDKHAANFMDLTQYRKIGKYYQATNIPNNTGTPIAYEGSTTGPGYNEKGSPYQVSWSVRPQVMKVNIETVGQWCKGNDFKENHGHGVRNLVKNPDLLSKIK